MLAFSLLVAGSFPLGVRIAHFVDPLALTAARFWIAAAVVSVVVALGPSVKRTDFNGLWRYFALGGVFSIYFVLMFEALKTAASISTAAIFTLTPIMSAFFAWMLLRQKTTPWMAAALAIGGIGAVWVVFRGDLNAMLEFDLGRGEWIFLFGCFAHAFYTPLVRKLNQGEHPAVFTLGTIIAGGIILSVLAFQEIVTVNWFAMPVIFWIGLAYLSICATASSFFCVQYATLYLPSAKVMAYTYLIPTWVIIWELAFGSPLPPTIVLLGVVTTIVALVMLLSKR